MDSVLHETVDALRNHCLNIPYQQPSSTVFYGHRVVLEVNEKRYNTSETNESAIHIQLIFFETHPIKID